MKPAMQAKSKVITSNHPIKHVDGQVALLEINWLNAVCALCASTLVHAHKNGIALQVYISRAIGGGMVAMSPRWIPFTNLSDSLVRTSLPPSCKSRGAVDGKQRHMT